MTQKPKTEHWWNPNPPHPQEQWPAFLYELARRTDQIMVKNPDSYPPWPERARTWRMVTIQRIRPLRDDNRNPPFGIMDFCPEAVICLDNGPGYSHLMAMRVNLRASDKTIVDGFKSWLSSQREGTTIQKPRPNKGQKRNWKPWQNIEILDEPFLEGNHSKASRRSRSRNKLPKQYLTEDILVTLRRR